MSHATFMPFDNFQKSNGSCHGWLANSRCFLSYTGKSHFLGENVLWSVHLHVSAELTSHQAKC